MVPRSRVVHFVRAIILKEAETAFARLRRVPSTYTWRCVEHLQTLAPPRQEKFFDDIADRAPVFLGLEPPPTKWQSPEMAKFYDEVLQSPSQHISARLLRGMAAAKRTDGPQGLFSNLSDALVRQADSIRPTTASRIRKDVERELEEHFGATAHNLGGGSWIYKGRHSGRPFSVMIDYGGRVDQLRYYVQLSDASTGLKTRTLNYETLLGLGFGQWDFVTADSQLENVRLLRELIQELVLIPDELVAFGSA
jgi:hypothetical protein